MKTIFNGQLDFDDNQKLEFFLENIDLQSTIKIIEMGIEKSLSEGTFNLTESYCLYKCINYLKTLDKINNDDK